MLGIEDKSVWLAYVLCIISALLCVIYAYLNWNRGDEVVEPDDLKWEEKEKKVEENL